MRNQTYKVRLSENVIIGGNNKVFIQTMCNIKTSHVVSVIKQIKLCEKNGADIIRVSVLDKNDAKAIKKIKSSIKIPIVADIHFDYKMALFAIKYGVDAIRINPNNISKKEIAIIVNKCLEKKIPIRLGINASSFKNPTVDVLIKNAKENIEFLEKLNFKNIVLSIKSSDVKLNLEVNKIASKMFKYPIHLGLTESGPSSIGIVKSISSLAPLLIEGIGNTIRISLSDDPVKELLICKRLLNSLDLYDNYPNVVSCPTCGRTKVKNLFSLTNKVFKFLEENNINKKVAIMGCSVNGPGEVKNSDIGIIGGNKEWLLFKNGVLLKRNIKEDEIYNELINLIKN